jgi:hypothetical protein
MSYVEDLLSPALMIVAASVTFLGASHYYSKSIGAARPILALNGFYHVFIMARIVHANEGLGFFSQEYGSARTILLSLGCVSVMEVRRSANAASSSPLAPRRSMTGWPPCRCWQVATLKKASSFYARLARAPSAELRTLRTSRRAHVGWAQRLIVLVMFVLICAPVVARYVCGAHQGSICD